MVFDQGEGSDTSTPSLPRAAVERAAHRGIALWTLTANVLWRSRVAVPTKCASWAIG